MHSLQRTVLISLGDEASALAAEVSAVVDLPILAHVDLAWASDDLDEEGDLAAQLLAALQAVSNAAALDQLLAQGATLERTDEIAVWLLVDIDAAGRLQKLLCARQQTMDLAWRHFRCTLPTHALVLSAPQLGAETEAVLAALEALPQPLESLLLAGQVNADGLSLSAGDVRARLREALRQLIISPLRHLPALFWKAVPPPPWSAVWAEQGRQEQGAAAASCEAGMAWQTPPLLAMGVQFYPNPAARLWDAFGLRWVQAALGRLVAAGSAEADASRALAPELLAWQPERLDGVLEGMMAAPRLAAAESYGRPGWAQLGGLLSMVEQDEARAQGALGQAASRGVAQIAVWARQWQQELEDRLACDLTPNGALPDLAEAGRYLDGCRRQWLAWADAMEAELASMETAHARLIKRRAAAGAAVEMALARIPGPGLGAVLRLLLRPRLWSQSLRAYGMLDAALGDNVAAADAVLGSEIRRRRWDLLRQHYLVGAEQAGRVLALVQTLAATLRQAQATAAPASPVEDAAWDEAACERLYGELMGDGVAALKRYLAQKPLAWRADAGGWRTYEDAALLLADLRDFAGRWLGPLLGWGADRFVAFALADDEERLAVWLQSFVAAAAPLWPTGLQACTLREEASALAVPDPEDSPLLPLMRRWAEHEDWQIVRTQASDPLVVLRLCLLRQV